MSLGAAITLIMIGASVVQCMVVGSFALARRKPRLKWLAANCVAGAGYSLGCFLSASDWLPSQFRWFSGPVGYSMAAFYFSTVICFLNITLNRQPAKWERWAHISLCLMAALVWVPGTVFVAGEIRTWEYAWTTYSFPVATNLVWLAGPVMFAGVFMFANVLWNCPRVLQVAGLFFATCAGVDVLNCMGIVHLTWFAALGTLVFLAVLSQREANVWATEANLLTELKLHLEDRVAERSAELAASRDELAKHERLASLGRLAASVGHEINNPLTYVLCNLEMLRMKYDDDPAIDDAIDGASRIARIVAELAILSRPSNEEDCGVFDLKDVVNTAAKTVQHKLTDLRTMEINCSPDCYVEGDADRLTQLVVNLLSNALSSLSAVEPGTVKVSTSVSGEHVVLVVQDDGCGIPESVQTQIFEPFVTTKSEGIGLGLAISRVIVNESGGRMTFDSKVGVGTRFEVQLPLSKRGVLPADDSKPANLEAGNIGGRVLVVDDEPAVLTSFERMLEGCRVTTVSDGNEAMWLIDEEHFDVVFCDIVMPGLTGIEILEQLQRKGSMDRIKFVLMSGGNPNRRASIERWGTAQFLQKPFSVADVHQLVQIDGSDDAAG